ncbi:metal ABC transporter substrate-binding protein [Pontimonas sp.]|nr:metal ABC transporter substrate-binding protein [Pontimonas sp.]
MKLTRNGRRWGAMVSLAAMLTVAGCSEAGGETVEAGSVLTDSAENDFAPSVVVTTTILGSVVSDIATCAVGDDSSVTVLMPLGADPHDFQASSAQVAQMAKADLIVANGLGLEEGMMDAIENIEADGGPVMEIASLLDPLPFGYADEHAEDDHADHDHSAEEDAAEEEAHDHGDFDPHFWFDLERMARAAELIGAELALTGGEAYETCGVSVASDIRATELEVVTVLEEIPESDRILVTDHDSLGYFADRYDFRIVGVVIPGGSTLGETNSQELAALVATMTTENVAAIFGDTATNSELLDVLASELDSDVSVIQLYVGSLGGPDSGAETYQEMMLINAALIAQGLS